MQSTPLRLPDPADISGKAIVVKYKKALRYRAH